MRLFFNIFLIVTVGLSMSCSPILYDYSGYQPSTAGNGSYTPYQYEHRLIPGDQLAISVWDHPDLSVGSVYEPMSMDSKLGKWVEIDTEGFATLPMIGQVKLGGQTLKEAEATLEKVYEYYIESPHISLKITNMEITITGEVNKPGVYTIDRQSIPLPKLLGLSGGATKYAKTDEIQIIRGNPAAPRVIISNLSTIEGMTASTIHIYPEDIVHIPSKKGKKLDQTAQKLVPIVGILSAIAIIFSATSN